MERKRGQIIAVVVALVIAVVSLGVAFAAFSTTITINGNATVQATTWNIFFDDDTSGTGPTGTVHVSKSTTAASTVATLTSTTFTWGATLKTPGDYVIWDFYVRNTGDYPAKINSITTPALTCTYADESSASSFCTSHVEYGIYKNAECTQPVAQNDQLAAKTGSAHYYVKVLLKDNFNVNGSDLPTQAVTVQSNTISVIYGQNGNAQ